MTRAVPPVCRCHHPKGLEDRTESQHVLQRAHEIAAEAWNSDFCRFVTGGSTQSLHTALAAVARPGDTVLFAANVHKAERAHALATGLDAVIVPIVIDEAWDVEDGVAPATLVEVLEEVGRWANNRVENSHLSFRRRERAMLSFRRMKTLQKLASVHANVHNHFNHERHLVDRQTYKQRRSAALAQWQILVSGASRPKPELHCGETGSTIEAAPALFPSLHPKTLC